MGMGVGVGVGLGRILMTNDMHSYVSLDEDLAGYLPIQIGALDSNSTLQLYPMQQRAGAGELPHLTLSPAVAGSAGTISLLTISTPASL
jgi:hypothetical protein